MEKLNIDKIVKLGKSKKLVASNGFEVKLAKLLTAIVMDPSLGLDYEFVTKRGKTNLEIRPISDMYNCEPSEINISGGTIGREIQLMQAINKVFNFMKKRKILNYEDFITRSDHVLWSALDRVANRISLSSDEDIQEYLSRLGNKTLQLNAFRKALSGSGRNIDENIECVLGTTLGALNYFSNAPRGNNPLARVHVNERTYFNAVQNIEYINKAVAFGCRNDYHINDHTCARTVFDDRKAEYLAGLTYSKYSNGKSFSNKQIDVANCKNMTDVVSQVSESNDFVM